MKNNRQLTKDQLMTNIDYLESKGFYIEDQEPKDLFCIETETGKHVEIHIYIEEPRKENLLNYLSNFDVNKEARIQWEEGWCNHNYRIQDEEDLREDIQKFIDNSMKIVENMEF